MTSRAGAGHFGPLRPFADALRDAGHQVLVAIQESGVGMAEAAGHAAWPLEEAPREQRAPVFERATGRPTAESNAIVIGELFAGLDVRAAVPGAYAAVAEFLPDLIVHESCEFSGPLAAERAAIPSAHVSIGLGTLGASVTGWVAPSLDRLRGELGLAPDPGGERVYDRPMLSLTPPARRRRRARPPLPRAPPGRRAGTALVGRRRTPARLPLVRLGRAHDADVPAALPRGDRAARALADPPAREHRPPRSRRARAPARERARRALGRRGRDRPPRRRDGQPRRRGQHPRRARRRDTAGRAAAVRRAAVQRGGGCRAGAGITADGVAGVGDALRRLLANEAYARRAQAIAAEVAALPPVSEAVRLLAQIADSTSSAARSPVSTAPLR